MLSPIRSATSTTFPTDRWSATPIWRCAIASAAARKTPPSSSPGAKEISAGAPVRPAEFTSQMFTPIERSSESEMMDRPDVAPDLLADDLKNLRLLNRYLGGARALRLALAPLIQKSRSLPLTLLDVGAGSGDIARHLARWYGRRGIAARIVTMDRNPVGTAVAAERNRTFAALTAVRADAAAVPFAPRTFDCVMASQLLHHFTAPQIIEMLRAWAPLARRAIVISDLVRHPLAYYGIRALPRVCP